MKKLASFQIYAERMRLAFCYFTLNGFIWPKNLAIALVRNLWSSFKLATGAEG
jgi:hypothetical protein